MTVLSIRRFSNSPFAPLSLFQTPPSCCRIKISVLCPCSFVCNDSENNSTFLVNVTLGHPMITFTTLVRLGRLKGKMFVPFNLFFRLTDISLRLAIQKTKFCSTVGALVASHQLFGVVDGTNGNRLRFVICCRIYR